jgi:multidrug efflux system outer membrane protein
VKVKLDACSATPLDAHVDSIQRGAGRRNAQLRASAAAAQTAYQTAAARYQSGLSDFINVLNAQAAVFTARSQLAQSDGKVDQHLVSLYKALGGGWNDATMPG